MDMGVPSACIPGLLTLYRNFIAPRHLWGLPLALDMASLAHFAASPSILSLEAMILQHTAQQFFLSGPGHIFSILEELTVHSDDLSAAQAILANEGFENLAVLHLINMDHNISCNVPHILNHIGLNKPDIKLESLGISYPNSLTTHVLPPDMLTLNFISPILCYRYLTSLHINVAQLVTLDNMVLACMVEAWPCLQELHLCD